jgi:aerotolerance regulator-like protein/VWA domain-containing protein/CARDB protein
MSVFFLYPALLFGLFAASLPILIHLLNRRKLKRIQFPAVRFILLSQKRISRSYRLRHWILLALRTLAVVFLALLLANPIFQIGAGLFAGSGPVSLVVLLDNSLSMTWSGDGNGFRQAKDAARLLISGLNDGDRAALIPTNIDGKEPFRLKAQKDVLLKELDGIEIADGTANLPAALSKAYELLVEPAGQKEIRLITDMGLTGWDQFSVAGLKQVDPSIAFKLIHIGRKQQPLNGTIKTIRLTSQGVGVNLPTQIEATVANFGDSEIKDVLVQLSIDGQNREQKLATVPAGGETSVNFQTRVNQAGAHVGQVTLKKDGLAGNPTTHFALDAQDKLKILVVDGDPQTSLVQSETFFLSRALNPAGDSSLFLPTVILPDALNSATLDGYQVVMLCNVAALSDAFVTKLQNFLRQGGGVLIFGGDKFQPESYSQRWPQALPGELREKKLGPEASGEKIGKFDLDHPVLQNLSEDTLQESLKSARVWGYTRTAASGKAALISLTNGDPLLLEQKIGSGKLMLFTTSADRDWSDLPVKTVYLPLVQALAQYLAGGKRGALDAGIPVGTAKELSLPPGYVGKSLRVTKPDKQSADIPIAGEKDHAQATIEVNDRAGIYRLAYPTGTEKDIGAPQLYSANSPFLESRLDEISARELQSKLSPIRAEVIPVDALKDGGSRTDLALPVLALLIVTLLIEGWLAQRF